MDFWAVTFGDILGIIVGVTIAFFIALAFRFIWIPKPEQIINENTKQVRKKMISHLNEVNYWMYRLFEDLQKIEKFDPAQNQSYDLSPYQFDQFRYAKERILDLWKKIQILHGTSSSIIFNEYLAIQKHVTAIHATVQFTSNREDHIFFDAKALQFVWYYAKMIILEIDNNELGKFNNNWQLDFDSIGGIDKIERPKLEPGDIVSLYNEMDDELFYYDAKFSAVMKELREIKTEVSRKNDHQK